MKYYMTTEPFTLTNIDTLETTEYNNLEDILTAALKSSCTVYIYELSKLAQAIVNKLDKFGYEEQSTVDLDNGILSRIDPMTFIQLGSLKERTTLLIRLRRLNDVQVIFQNVKALFGKATIEDICLATIGENEEIFGMCTAIDNLLEEGHTLFTLAGNALKDLKTECFGRMVNGKLEFGDLNFLERFPKLTEEVHEFVMKGFQGGLCYFNTKYTGTHNVEGTEYDVNSMYPSVMLDEFLPYGEPDHFFGEFDKTIKRKPMYFQRVIIDKLLLKDDGIPCIRNKEAMVYYEVAENVELVLNSIDIEMLFDNYNVEGIKYVDGYRFNGRRKMFNNFINKWAEKKKAAADGSFERMYAKLMLNSTFGKFASRTDRMPSKYRKSNGKLIRYKHVLGKKRREGNSVYAPVGSYITSYARQRLIKAIKENKENFIYSDTDSMYVKGEATGIEIDKAKFGAWKEEFKFTRMTIIGKKQYCVEKTDGSVKVVLAGIPDKVVEKITKFEDFYLGKKIDFEIKKYDLEGNAYIKQQPTVTLKDHEIQ